MPTRKILRVSTKPAAASKNSLKSSSVFIREANLTSANRSSAAFGLTTPTRLLISPGQGLLVLIAHLTETHDGSDATTLKLARLKRLYLCGAENRDVQDEIFTFHEDPILSSFQVSFTKKTINNDPTRRYFETHLAYETLNNGLEQLDFLDLENHFLEIKRLFDSVKASLFDDQLESILSVSNVRPRVARTLLHAEYSDFMYDLKNNRVFNDFSADKIAKIKLLVESTFYSVTCAQLNLPLPLNIYQTRYFSSDYRGVKTLAEQEHTRSSNRGLLKGYMPVSRDDIALSSFELNHLKPSDQSTYDSDNEGWVQSNFNQLVHPFSNSLSGTSLCTIRMLAQLNNDGKGVFTASFEKMTRYCQLFVSCMLYYSGGHSLNEFIEPFELKPVKQEFNYIPSFDEFGLHSMFLLGNNVSFDAAISNAIEYNRNILHKQLVHTELTGSNVKRIKENTAVSAKDDSTKSYRPYVTTTTRTTTKKVIYGYLSYPSLRLARTGAYDRRIVTEITTTSYKKVTQTYPKSTLGYQSKTKAWSNSEQSLNAVNKSQVKKPFQAYPKEAVMPNRPHIAQSAARTNFFSPQDTSGNEKDSVSISAGKKKKFHSVTIKFP